MALLVRNYTKYWMALLSEKDSSSIFRKLLLLRYFIWFWNGLWSKAISIRHFSSTKATKRYQLIGHNFRFSAKFCTKMGRFAKTLLGDQWQGNSSSKNSITHFEVATMEILACWRCFTLWETNRDLSATKASLKNNPKPSS